MTSRLDIIRNRSAEIAAMFPNSVFADETNELVGYILILSGEVERFTEALNAKEAINRAFHATLDLKDIDSRTLQAELERVTKERDAIKEAFESFGRFGGTLTGLCEYCGADCIMAKSDDRDIFQCGSFKWRGCVLVEMVYQEMKKGNS